MRIELFLTPFLIAFALTTGLVLLLLLTPLFRRTVWRFGGRHRSKKSISRLGGVAMLLAFVFVLFFDANLVVTREFYGLLLGMFFIFVSVSGMISMNSDGKSRFFQVALTALVSFLVCVSALPNPFGNVGFPIQRFRFAGILPPVRMDFPRDECHELA
jgi:UDP-N-acetylmuramyl pentapeptide phosphotransferase/UDP-N-acetylglucosamine-1-phosphate transferase